MPRGSIVLIEQALTWRLPHQRLTRFAMRVAAARMVADRSGAPLLELEAASVWRLARPFRLSDVLADTSAYADQSCPIRRFSNIHEQEIRRNELLRALGLPFDARGIDEEVKSLFLTLWNKGMDSPAYQKGEWTRLRSMLEERGILT